MAAGINGYLKVDHTAEPNAAILLANPTLTHLDFNSGRVQTIETLAQALRDNETLTRLSLRHNFLSEESLLPLTFALKSNETLTELDVRSNNISSQGFTDLAQALRRNTGLTSMRLGGNWQSPHSGGCWGELLKSNSTLKRLDLRSGHYLDPHQGLRDAGVKFLTEALTINSTLTHLNVANNFLTADSATLFADLLTSNKTLTTLNLEGNKIEADGTIALAAALRVNTTLTDLRLSHNDIGVKGLMALNDMLDVNTTLTRLDLNDSWADSVKGLVSSIKAKILRNLENRVFNSFADQEKHAVHHHIWVQAGKPTGDHRFGKNNVFIVDRSLFKRAVASAGIDLKTRIDAFKKA